MKKSLISLLSLVVLTACGGGGGGSNNDTPTTVVQERCGNMPEMSCAHNLDDLTLNVWLEVGEQYKLTAKSDFAHMNGVEVYLHAPDKLEIHAQGQVYKPTVHHSPATADTYDELPNDASSYEVYWWRNDTVVAQGIVDRLPKLVDGVWVSSDQTTDNLSIHWNNNSDFVYDIDVRYMTCTAADGNSKLFFPATSYYQELTAPFEIPALTLFGKRISELKESYSKCVVEFNTFGKDTTIKPVNLMDEKIYFHVLAYQTHVGTVFEQ